MWETEFMIRYNTVFNRYRKAEEFLSSATYKTKDGKVAPYSSLEEEIKYKEKWLKEFYNIVKELSALMKEYREKTGMQMNEEDINNGFIF